MKIILDSLYTLIPFVFIGHEDIMLGHGLQKQIAEIVPFVAPFIEE